MCPASSFAHRYNRDETFESICRSCYITVATRSQEAGLEPSEQGHTCESHMLERFQPIEQKSWLS